MVVFGDTTLMLVYNCIFIEKRYQLLQFFRRFFTADFISARNTTNLMFTTVASGQVSQVKKHSTKRM